MVSVEIDDPAREVMYEELTSELDGDAIDSTLEHFLKKKLTEMYDNRDRMEKRDEPPAEE